GLPEEMVLAGVETACPIAGVPKCVAWCAKNGGERFQSGGCSRFIGERLSRVYSQLPNGVMGRWADRLQISDRSAIPSGAGVVQKSRIAERIVLADIHDLTGPDVGIEQVWALLCHLYTENRAPRPAQQDDPVF